MLVNTWCYSHYSLMRVALWDYKCTILKPELDKQWKWATPRQLSSYITCIYHYEGIEKCRAWILNKVVLDPVDLFSWIKSKLKIGCQSLAYRLTSIFNCVIFVWDCLNLTNYQIRRELKSSFFTYFCNEDLLLFYFLPLWQMLV